ncbi:MULTISPECIES: sulfite exporter TauE/SafE family protein [Luteimonas]|uniref:sulfite exporter TauE/SafE family protein n=1 Tax=Luteimonas TaxID=83614 RepID=UPI000C7B600A|nr:MULTISPECIES: sulfite exporter TauE/SafE family protein [Luteimonas]
MPRPRVPSVPRRLVFPLWLCVAGATLLALFNLYSSLPFLAAHWYYPATMVVGAFVAGSTPEGGGAVAFPVLNIFLSVDRVLARDFSLMVQSIGMTSASILILSRKESKLADFRPLLWWVPVAFVGFIVGMATLQGARVPVIQALFLSLIAAFAVVYLRSPHRGFADAIQGATRRDHLVTSGVLFMGGLCASLFGTGADILLYTLLVTRFALKEKRATEMSIVLMASLSVLGYAWRGLVQGELTAFQIQTWLCAAPVVLVMAPLGSAVLRRIPHEWMLRAIVVLNIGQLAYFNLVRPTWEKTLWSLALTALLLLLFGWVMGLVGKHRNRLLAAASR